MGMLRDLVGAEYKGPKAWSLWSALKAVAEVEHGVVVILASHESSQSLLSRVTLLNTPPSSHPLRHYSTTGTGSQILADLGAGRLRLMGAPLNYKGLSGFELEVVEVDTP